MSDGGRQRRRSGDGSSDKLDELDVTKEELDGIGAALKDERFRKLLCEYVDEITDPENRAQYEREMEQYERERGVQVTFVRPRPGYVMKTSADGARKVFVNVCSSDAVAKPACRPDAGGHRWSLPHCLSPVRRDYDRARRPCDVYDVIFHPDVLEMATAAAAAADPRFRDMVEDTALSMVEKTDGVALDRANIKYPKVSFKGVARSLVVRKRVDGHEPTAADLPGCPPYEPPVDRPVQHHDLGELKQKSLFAVPKYAIKYRSDVDIQEHGYGMHCKMNAVIPKELIVEIKLPLLDSSANVELDVQPKSLKMVCDKPSKYRLDVDLPYAVLKDEGNATFDQSTRTLIVRLPVFRTEPPLIGYVDQRLVSEVDTSKNEKSENGCDVVIDTKNRSLDSVVCQESKSLDVCCGKSMNGDRVSITSGHHDVNMNKHEDDTTSKCTNGSNITENCDNVHYSLPEHELIFDDKCILTLNVKNVDPTSINVIVENDKNLISGKLQSIGSGFFPLGFAFCLQMPSKMNILMSDVKVLPSDKNVVIEFPINFKPEFNQYWFGLNQDTLMIQYIKIEILKENLKSLANSISVAQNDSDDDVFDNSKEEIESKNQQQNNIKKNHKNLQCRDNNGKILKEKRKKKNQKKFQKSNAIPIVVDGSLTESNKNADFVPSSLPIELSNIKPTIRGILKKRSLSECNNADDVVLSSQLYSSSMDNVDTESSDVQELNFNDSKKTVRFNDHVIEKKINFNISIAAQAKKHRQRQQRKRNIREYNTPSESEASEAEDRIFGPLNVVSESEETSVSESSAGEMSDDNSSGPDTKPSKVTVVADSKKDHKRRKSKSARKNASLAKQASTNNLIFPIDY